MAHDPKLLEEAVAAVAITGPTSFTWFGTPSPRIPSRVRASISPSMARAHLLSTLTAHLYNRFYQVGFASSVAPEAGEASVTCRETQLGADLSTANCGSGYWQPGWVVHNVEGGTLALRRQTLTVWAGRERCRANSGVDLNVGAQASVWLPKESFNLSPGYYSAMSDEPLIWKGSEDTRSLVRLYWNVAPDHAARLVEVITSSLNDAHRPFRLKVLDDAIAYTRCDTAVLYLVEPDLTAAAAHLARAWGAVSSGIRPGTPAFTKEVAPGVGLAEDPRGVESFGEHRCRAMAEGLIRAHERGQRRLALRLETIMAAFLEEGIDVTRPYLASGRVDKYDLRLRHPTMTIRSSREVAGTSKSDSFLAVAEDLGRRLCAEAVWYGDRCNWMGLLPHVHGHGEIGLSYGGLGHDVYDGTSGVAVFLAHLHALTGADPAGRTSAGAVRQALWAAERSAMNSLALYNGASGLALAASLVGRLLGDEPILQRGRRLAMQIANDDREIAEFDLLSGKAGALCALIVFSEMFGEERPLESALRLGDSLLVTAEKSSIGWSWRTPNGRRHQNLTGFSHGAAGIGYALLELFDLTGDERYREGAEEAFRYEDCLFDSEARNWPDFRDGQMRRKRRAVPKQFRTQWCHGAPGIALSRLRAYEVLGNSHYRDEAVTALATTQRSTSEALLRRDLSWCLCHGIAGNADVLIEGRRILPGDARDRHNEVPEEIGTIGVDLYHGPALPWPCGIPVPGRETPGLMLGLAGIGYFYLRLRFPNQVPSLLLLRRHDFRDLGRKPAAGDADDIASGRS